MTLLKISDLVVEARDDKGIRRIVDEVSVEVAPGEVVGLIGESGAGKSTLGLAALGYTRPHSRFAGGSILFDGQELLRLSRAERLAVRGAKVAYVAQSAAASFNPAKTLDAQVCEPPVLHGLMSGKEAQASAAGLYRELALPDPDRFGQRYPHQVSGGQLQRAMVAMAMSSRPRLIVFDEPTTALDVTTQVEVLASIRNIIRKHGTAALYISHDLAVVAQIADRILVLRHGRMVETGPTEEILSRPTQPYTRELVAARQAHPKVAPPRQNLILEASGIDAAYAGGLVKVLSNIDLDVSRGETVAIVGESGSGKSTFARVVTGLLPATKGRLTFMGKPLTPALAQRSPEERRRIQLVHQMPDTALNPKATVGQILGRPLTMFRKVAGRDLQNRIGELLRLVDLAPDLAGRFPGQLSGGQKQRVCIARGLAADPDLLVCDEVTSALDPLVAEGILQLLMRLQEETGVGILLITHDLGVVRNYADRVVVLEKGVVVDQGTVAEIFHPPYHGYTGRLLSSVPELRPGWLDGVLASRAAA
ncbi:MAG: ABC transporter ATP-binding protein [Geminicoccaceae bacterium]